MNTIGIDYHKASFTVCYRSAKAKETFAEFPSTEDCIADFLTSVTCFDQLAVEAMGMCRHFVKKVRPKVAKVTLVNAAKNLLITKSNKKTDKHDASMLAYGLAHGLLPTSRFRSEAAQQVRSMVGARYMLVLMRVRVINFMHAVIARNGQSIPKDKMGHKMWRDRIDLGALELGDRIAMQTLESQINQLHKDILLLKHAIEKASRQLPGYEVLASIPGFGPIRRGTLLATIDDIDDFHSPKALCAYLGIVPRVKMSAGQHIPSKFGRFRAGAITREGDVKARSALTMATNKALSANPSLRAFYDRIKGRKGYRKARTAAARKLLVLIYFALKSGKPIEDFSVIDFSKPHLLEG